MKKSIEAKIVWNLQSDEIYFITDEKEDERALNQKLRSFYQKGEEAGMRQAKKEICGNLFELIRDLI